MAIRANSAAIPTFPRHKLAVYGKSQKLFVDVHRLAKTFPRDEFVLKTQLIRAALSIPTNTAEGCSEYHPLDKAKFYLYAKRSAEETSSLIESASLVLFIDPVVYQDLQHRISQIMFMLHKLIMTMTTKAEASAKSKRRKK